MSPRGPLHKESRPGLSKGSPDVQSGPAARQPRESFGLLPGAALLLGLAFVVAAAYGPFYDNPFVSDDLFHLYHYRQALQLPLSKYLSFHPFEVFRPLFWLMASSLYHLFGFEPAVYHATGLALHAANSALLGVLAFMLTRSRLHATLSAGLFALSYLHSEPLLLRIAQVHVLGGFWTLLTLIAYVHFRLEERRWAYLLSVAFFFAAVFSNQAAVGIIFVCLFLDLLNPQGGASKGQRLLDSCLRLTPYLAAAGLSAAAYVYRGQLGRFTHLSNAARNAVTLLSHTWYHFGPQGITELFGRSSSPLAFAKGLAQAPNSLMIAALLATAAGTGALFLWKVFRGEPLERLGCFFFLVSFLPFISYFGLERRYFYIPMMGFSMVVSYWFIKIFGWWDQARPSSTTKRAALRLTGLLVLSVWVAYQVSFIRQAGGDYRRAGLMVSEALGDLDSYGPFAPKSRLYVRGLPRNVRYAIAFHPHFLQSLLRFRLEEPTLTVRWLWPEDAFPPAAPGTRLFDYRDQKLQEVEGSRRPPGDTKADK